MEVEEPLPSSSLRSGDDGARRRFRSYLLALEKERSKIYMFQRELPLCLDLVTQTIEGMRRQMDGGVVSDETVSDHGPVLEEFIPLKPSLSLTSSEEDSTHDAAPAANAADQGGEAERRPATPQTKKAMPDWLQSVQLWSQQPQQSNPDKELPCKPVALSATKAGGAFHPFEKENRTDTKLPASSTTAAAASSVVVGDSGDKATTSDTAGHEDKDSKVDVKDKEKEKEGQSQPNGRKPRRCWAPELHRRFLQALQQLGGSHAATPKQIRELMKVDGLTNDEVKSHLQKYRLHTTRRPSTTTAPQSSATAPAQQPAPQFVVVGSCIWVPPPEYAAAVAAAHPQVNLAAANSPGGAAKNPVYAPVATLPSGLQRHGNSWKQPKSSDHPEDQRSGESGGASSASPAVSSSSQATSA